MTGPARVAVVGRQNVGKSTLVNRLFGRREAIAAETPGVTRDRLELETTWRGRRVILVDTGGYLHRARGVEAKVARQAELAAESSDLVVFVVDAQLGVGEEDAALARRLRKLSVPVIVAANKVDGEREESDVAAFYSLGLGEPVPVSALHGRGSGDLLDRLVALIPEREEGTGSEHEPRFALVGRPNVGKSSLFNRLVGEERAVVFAEAGTTRDSVDAVVDWPGGTVRFIDTAGFRRPSRVQGVEYYSFVRTVRAVDRAEVAVLVLDAREGLTSEDKRIAARVIEAGRALLVAANKWDLVSEKNAAFGELAHAVGPFASAEVVRTSALRGTGLVRLPSAVLALRERWTSRVPTAEVNRLVSAAQDERPAPRGVGRYRYATQVAAGPPTFVLFGGKAPDPAYRRFLERHLREAFDWGGVPLRLKFRPRERGGGGARRG
ncbi:MAG TPA: ribosome biogenesis GTPase Der [Actinomycetota bacterium]|nr:ribosome biogenesis GTPase Der [Actinomycetota bacterium]